MTTWTVACQATCPLSMEFPRPEYWSGWFPSPGEGNGTPLQYACLENPMEGGAWWAAVHGVLKSWTLLSNFTFTFHFHALEKEMAFLPGESQGRWWAAVYGVTQSWTQLKRLSSSSSSSLLKEIFPTQGLIPGLLHCRWIPYCLSHQGGLVA